MFLLDEAAPKEQFPITTMVFLAVMGIVLYFFTIRPQTKQKKMEDQMRNSLKIGDEIVTAGGIIGRIVNVRESSDEIILETGADRNKIKIKRWAVATVNKPESTVADK